MDVTAARTSTVMDVPDTALTSYACFFHGNYDVLATVLEMAIAVTTMDASALSATTALEEALQVCKAVMAAVTAATQAYAAAAITYGSIARMGDDGYATTYLAIAPDAPAAVLTCGVIMAIAHAISPAATCSMAAFLAATTITCAGKA